MWAAHFGERGEHVGFCILALHAKLGFDFVSAFFSSFETLQMDSSGVGQALGKEVMGHDFALVLFGNCFCLFVHWLTRICRGRTTRSASEVAPLLVGLYCFLEPHYKDSPV